MFYGETVDIDQFPSLYEEEREDAAVMLVVRISIATAVLQKNGAAQSKYISSLRSRFCRK
jgi:hypothetical protein